LSLCSTRRSSLSAPISEIATKQTLSNWGLRQSASALFKSLSLALAKIIYDDDKNYDNPSIKRLHWQFSEERAKPESPLLIFLGNRWAERLNATTDQFNKLLDDSFGHWDRYSESPSWLGLKTLRNKVIAHSDITFSEGEWRLINPNELQFGVDDYDKSGLAFRIFSTLLTLPPRRCT
jgi:hypothetical protein